MSPPHEANADESWFSYWRRCRDQDPDSPLDVLLGGLRADDVAANGNRLIDIACMDLMQQRRNGRPACVEDYLQAFPTLDNESQRLDLIDAEMCIRKELQCPQTMPQWTARFPLDADAIVSLLRMDDWAAPPEVLVSDSLVENVTMIGASANVDPFFAEDDFSVDASDLKAISIPGPNPHHTRPIDPSATPDWFVGQKVFASGPGWWMIRGIHRETHATYALKIISLPSTISPSQIRRLNEVILQCSQTQHPNWVIAESSTVYNGHLGVLRPWVHGVAWHDQLGDIHTVVRRLAIVAMMVASTSASGRHHGGVHTGNLWINHQGQVMLLDAGSSRRGIRQWLTGGNGEFMTASQRAAWDGEELKSLIAGTLMRSPEPLADTILQGIRTPELTPLQLGEFLLAAADGKSLRTDAQSKSLSARFSKLIFRDTRRRT